MKKFFLPFILSLFFIFPAGAQSSQSFNFLGSGTTFKLTPATDGIIAGTDFTLYGTYFLCDKILDLKSSSSQPDTNFIFDINQVNPFDKNFMQPYSKAIDKVSDGLAAATILSPAFLMILPSEEWFTVGSMYAETAFLAYSLKCVGKFLINRPRPYMYFDVYPQKDVEEGDWKNSFPSAHATMSFAAATFSTYVFSKYYPESPWRYVVAGLSYTAAGATSLLRISSGCHFTSDILAGAAIGSFCGFIVPYLHTLNTNSNKSGPAISATPLGINFLIRF